MKKLDQEVSCPNCGWHPDGEAHWQCLCGHTWNVFSTGGRCPACCRQWEKTQCAPKAGGCSTWSPYLEWYGDLSQWLTTELGHVSTDKEEERRGSRGH
ncbi:MAG: hypothetical protein DA408_11095 [Bacteroidetes bacterium]|nr:MAG: hypothetical protein C7N36_03490 [Bacteroidota bacterium]PTM12314.1 MAG: hypothetical protein DA408_11095 [Bacteroidota bacterium]